MQCAKQDDIKCVKALEYKADMAGRYDVAAECRRIASDYEKKEREATNRAYLALFGGFCLCVLLVIAVTFLAMYLDGYRI